MSSGAPDPDKPRPTDTSDYLPGQVLMQVRNDSDVTAAAQSIGGTSWRASSMQGWYLVTLASGVSVDSAIARAQGNPQIETVEPNYSAN